MPRYLGPTRERLWLLLMVGRDQARILNGYAIRGIGWPS